VLRRFVERVRPGRWDTVPQPTPEELKMTGLLEFGISDVSGKIAMQGKQLLGVLPGGEYEAPDDANFSPWTGLSPYCLVKEEPVSSADLIGTYRVQSG
jgi:hypothetical protein